MRKARNFWGWDFVLVGAMGSSYLGSEIQQGRRCWDGQNTDISSLLLLTIFSGAIYSGASQLYFKQQAGSYGRAAFTKLVLLTYCRIQMPHRTCNRGI